jgi:branched-chain amino acid transport system permease protein
VSDLANPARLALGREPRFFEARRLVMIALALALFLVPIAAGGFLLYNLSLCFANALAVLSVSVLVRYGGEVSIGHSFFVALGAYTVAILEHQFKLSALFGLPCALIIGMLAGALFSFPSRRLSGIYLAVATMALALALPEILVGCERITGGFEGLYIALDPIAGISKPGQRYYICLVILIASCLMLAHFRHSPQGLALLMAKAQPHAAEAIGITRSWARISVFALSAALASSAGALQAFGASTVSPNSFTLWSGIFLLVGSVVSLNGLSLSAGLIGGAFITLVPNYLADAGDWVPIFYGVALIIVTLCSNNAAALRRFLRGREGR